MNKQIELLAPGGDIDSIKAAIAAGADAIYCGLNKFNARNRAVNIDFDDLNGILRLAHENSCQIFVTLNIVVVDAEVPALFTLLNKLINTGVDGLIVQDFGLFYLLKNYFSHFDVHASTQLTTHNAGQIKFLSQLGVSRVNLCRELNLTEIKELTKVAHENEVLTEVFVHGSNCICFSGACYISSVLSGNSGNRGRCSQPCRDQFIKTSAGNDFPLNLKDNSAFLELNDLVEVGVDSLKIEGRIKKFHYVYTIVNAWRKQLQRFYDRLQLKHDKSELYSVFNRDFTNSFLTGEISKNMFIDNPRDNSAIYLAEKSGEVSAETLEKAKGDVYDSRTAMIREISSIIDPMSVDKAPLTIIVSGNAGSPLDISITSEDLSFSVQSTGILRFSKKQVLDYETLFSRLKAINDTEFFIEKLNVANLIKNLSIPFKELTALKKQILCQLNDSREFLDPVEIPHLNKNSRDKIEPRLSVLINSAKDLHLCDQSSAQLYFQLPNCFNENISEFVDLFQKNPELIPWFPSILIGDDFLAAIELLERVQPKTIVTNNSGVAFDAYERGILWIAGPQLNIVNSYSLICLKEEFGCSGAFISSELSKNQIKAIKKPVNFKLFYSIYHPNIMMTSRQCLFHQVTGCEKSKIDDACIPNCEKCTSITNLKDESFIIEKSRGNYHRIYSEINFLNCDIIGDVPNLFDSYFVDLSDIATKTFVATDKLELVDYFERFIAGQQDINEMIQPTTVRQYHKGI